MLIYSNVLIIKACGNQGSKTRIKNNKHDVFGFWIGCNNRTNLLLRAKNMNLECQRRLELDPKI